MKIEKNSSKQINIEKSYKLVIIPCVNIWQINNEYFFDRKFYDGMIEYSKLWVGSIHCILEESHDYIPNFGLVKANEKYNPFSYEVVYNNAEIGENNLIGFDLVYVCGDSYKNLHISKLCKSLEIKCVYLIEYILETRNQITDLSTKNPFRKFRRRIFNWTNEKKRLQSFELADGIHANGVAAYLEYRKIHDVSLFFDTRMYTNLFINTKDLEERLNKLRENKPLQLAYSGRLIKMKGVDHLIKICNILNRKKINYTLHVYGSGELEESLKDYIFKKGMLDRIVFHGSVDFAEELIPTIKKNIDLYILLHRQSDPSCTYLETLACGIPIIGYDNKAFSGILNISDIGWKVKMNNIKGVAALISKLDNNRYEIIKKSYNSRLFALDHSFEVTYKNRIDHLRKIIDQ